MSFVVLEFAHFKLNSPLFSLLKHKTWPKLGQNIPQTKRVYAFDSINP
jgi:hypothetical protein